jgi:GMP synthase-like glutamine amidotransferase
VVANNTAGPVLVIENDVDDPVARLGDWLIEAGIELDIRTAPQGDAVPASLDNFSGLVVMGGWQNAYQDDAAPWLPAVRRLLAEAVRIGLPCLGVCLGGQLLAAATGGDVGRSATPEYGIQLIAKRQAAADDVLFGELPITPDVLQWHVDAITRLPAAATLLASSPGCEVQAFRVGPRAWGLQFHIETTPHMVDGWACDDAAALADYDVDTILERVRLADEDLREAWQPFAQRFAEVTRDPGIAAGSRTLPLAGMRQSSAAPITDPAEIRAALAAEMQAARGSGGG